MTEEEFESLPALTACPGKPGCDKDSLCGDHRDIFRWMQRAESKWRDTIVAAREARDRADLQINEARETRKNLLRDYERLALGYEEEKEKRESADRLNGELKGRVEMLTLSLESILRREYGLDFQTYLKSKEAGPLTRVLLDELIAKLPSKTEKRKGAVKPPHAVRCQCTECVPKKCDHGEIMVTHVCAYCGEKIDFV